ncbi:MAG: hypothetical protein ACJAYB_002552 [Psychromonas sp.]|jgi:hypothetical protein
MAIIIAFVLSLLSSIIIEKSSNNVGLKTV